MGTPPGRETDAVAFIASLAEAPHQYDFYQTLRRLECLYEQKPRWGEALRPVDEPVRLGQDPDLSFAPAPLSSCHVGQEGRPPRLQVRLFGLLGPNGPLPIHITEYARERLYNAGDPTFSRFLDIFHHRFLALFYRAWAQAQPHVHRDRPGVDRFAAYFGGFFGLAPAAFRDRDSVPDAAKLFHVGALIRHVRNAEGLAATLRSFFRVPVRIEEFVGHWLLLRTRERTYLGREGATLAVGAVVGRRVWDRQCTFRVHLGPLTLARYESFLPAAPAPRSGDGGPADASAAESTSLQKLVDWIRLYCSMELEWDARLVLRKDEVPRLTLGTAGRLGWTTWLGTRRSDTDADDLCLHAERFARPAGGPV
jgi:type VI secretion system protein ImpH